MEDDGYEPGSVVSVEAGSGRPLVSAAAELEGEVHLDGELRLEGRASAEPPRTASAAPVDLLLSQEHSIA